MVAELSSLGSNQPEPRAWRRKHIADGPEGAASRGANKAKDGPHWSSGARRGLVIDEVTVPVSFTVETTVLPSFARQHAS